MKDCREPEQIDILTVNANVCPFVHNGGAQVNSFLLFVTKALMHINKTHKIKFSGNSSLGVLSLK